MLPLSGKQPIKQGLLLGGIALLSSGSLLLEVVLTRIHAVLSLHYYVSAMPSIAVVGILVASIAVAITVALSFFLGSPFPMGLQVAGERAAGTMVSFALAVKGLASVVGSAGGVALAIVCGFHAMTVVGDGVYLAVALLGRRGLA